MTQPSIVSPGQRRLPNRIWVLELIPLGIGLWIGREIAYAQSLPGNAMGVFTPIIAGFAIVVVLVVVGLVQVVRRSGRAARLAFAAGGLIVVAAFLMVQFAARLGLLFEASGMSDPGHH